MVRKLPTPITRPHSGTSMEPPQYPSTDPRYSQSQQAVTGTSMPTQWAPVPRYPTNAMVPDTFRRPTIVEEHRSIVNSTQESEGPMPASHTRPTQLQHQQLQTTVTRSYSSAVCTPTPSMGTSSSPDRPQPKPSPRRVNRNRTPEPPTSTAGRTPSPRHAMQQQVLHPYSRPANVRQYVFLGVIVQLTTFRVPPHPN